MEKTKRLATRLAHEPALGALGEASLAAMAHAARWRELRPEQILWEEGEEADELALVWSGRIDIVHTLSDGRRVTVHQLAPNSVVGWSMVAGVRSTATLLAALPSTVALVPGKAVREAVTEHPRGAILAIAALGVAIGRLSSDLWAQRTLDVDDRVRRFVVDRCRERREIKMSHAEIAECVGASRPRVSEALKRLESEGLVRCVRGCVAWCG